MFDIYSPTDGRAARVEKWDADRIEAERLEISLEARFAISIPENVAVPTVGQRQAVGA